MRLGMSWLDLKLGLRMLLKYPGLAAVGVFGMATAIAIGATFYALLRGWVLPSLPLAEGDRIVGIETWDAAANHEERRVVHDFAAWREGLASVRELGAFRTVRRNLIGADGRAEVVHVAEMTASGFGVARIPPQLGRTLRPDDERPGAPPVVVLGDGVWRARFAADPAVLGRTLRLGRTDHTIVGVMPPGYAFPISHDLWTALPVDPARYERREGPELFVFGRLAPGATVAVADAELQAAGERAAAASPATHGQLRPRVVAFTSAFGPISGDGPRWAFYLLELFVSLLLVVVAANVAILVYARAATRRGEIAARSALGASRWRIVGQLVAEALVMSSVAAFVGVGVAALVMRWLHALMVEVAAHFGGMPFWIEPALPASTFVYVAALTAIGAAIVGVVPALQLTGRDLQSGLRELAGGGGLRLGRTWSTLIVAQVALAVALLPLAVAAAVSWVRYGYAEPGYAVEEFLSARVEIDQEEPPTAVAGQYRRELAARYGARLEELLRRLEGDAAVSGASFAEEIPGQEGTVAVEVQGVPQPRDASVAEVRRARVAPDFFALFEVPLLAGRRFDRRDTVPEAASVVVNRAFVEQVLGGASPLGRRLRLRPAEDGAARETAAAPWHEIVGVVADFPAEPLSPEGTAASVYHAVDAAAVYPATLLVRMAGEPPASLAGRLADLTAAVDPALRPQETLPLDRVYGEGEQAFMRIGALTAALVTLSVLLLSAAGVYALMSFTLTRRRREIGIRAALGADPRRMLVSIFSRALRQVVAGVVLGVVAAAALFRGAGELTGGDGGWVLAVVALVMLAVGLLATLGPALRALRVEPTVALESEG